MAAKKTGNSHVDAHNKRAAEFAKNQGNPLATGLNRAEEQGGGIRAGAHPEFENSKPGLANPFKQIGAMLKPKPKPPKAAQDSVPSLSPEAKRMVRGGYKR